MVLWMWHDVTLHPLWKIQATPLTLKLLYTILCNSEQASFWGSTYSHRITILLHFPVLLPLHRYPRLHLRVESLRLLDPLSKKERKKGWIKKAAETSDQRARFQSLGNYDDIRWVFKKSPVYYIPNIIITAKNFAYVTSRKFAENRMALSEDLSMLDLVSW